MDIKKFVLSYYKNATDDFHINEIMRPKGALVLHTHDYFQIYYLKSGSIIHHLEGDTATLNPGDVFIIPPNLPHYIETSREPIRFFSISFTAGFLSGIADSNKFVADFMHYINDADRRSIAPSFTLFNDDIPFTDALVAKIMSEFGGDNIAKETLIRASVGLLLTVFARSYFAQRSESIRLRSEREAIAHCLGYIENHLSESISLSDVAKMSAMSRSTFCRAFRRVTGETFKSYLNRIRIERASELLREGESVETVARLTGFNDPSTFYRNFKKQTGITPRKFNQA